MVRIILGLFMFFISYFSYLVIKDGINIVRKVIKSSIRILITRSNINRFHANWIKSIFPVMVGSVGLILIRSVLQFLVYHKDI